MTHNDEAAICGEQHESDPPEGARCRWCMARALEAFRERALKAEHLQRRACAETVVFKMFALKVAARPGDHQRDAQLLAETGPSTLAEGLLAVVEAARDLDATLGAAPGTPPHPDALECFRSVLATFDRGRG